MEIKEKLERLLPFSLERSVCNVSCRYGNEHKIISNIVKQVSTRIQRVPIHNEISDVDRKVSQASQSVPGVSQTAHKATKVKMPIPHWDFKAEKTWRVVGLMSSVVGLLCYALSPSFNRLIGRWKPFKFFLYGVSSLPPYCLQSSHHFPNSMLNS